MTSGPNVIMSRNSAVAAATGSEVIEFDTSGINALHLAYTTLAYTGGTAPDIRFYLDVQGADGSWYRTWTGPLHTAVSPRVMHFLPAGAYVNTAADVPGIQHIVFASRARFGWIFGGTVVATSIKFTYSLIGRNV